MPTLALGPFVFSDFEIPEALPLGGAQTLVNHKLPGGARIIDAMGQDEADITWAGRFRGSTGVDRAKFVDELRIAGQPLVLTFANFRRTVLISSFTYQVERAGLEIPYSITLVVVSNDDVPLPGPPPPSVADLMAADIAAAIAQGLQIAELQISMQELQVAYQAYKSAQAGNISALGTLATSLTTATAAAAQAANASDNLQTALIATNQTVNTAVKSTSLIADAFTMPLGGGTPSSMAASVVTAGLAFSSLSSLLPIGSMLTRAGVNNGNSMGSGNSWTGPGFAQVSAAP